MFHLRDYEAEFVDFVWKDQVSDDEPHDEMVHKGVLRFGEREAHLRDYWVHGVKCQPNVRACH